MFKLNYFSYQIDSILPAQLWKTRANCFVYLLIYVLDIVQLSLFCFNSIVTRGYFIYFLYDFILFLLERV